MPINYDYVKSLSRKDMAFSYDEKHTMLYALATGFGSDPTDLRDLPFVYEKKGPAVVPTVASTFHHTFGSILKDCGWDAAKVLHGEQKFTIHKPIPPAADIYIDDRVIEAYDKGPDKGAVILTERDIRLQEDGSLLCTLVVTSFARAEGGFGGAPGSGPAPHPIPDREPDLSCEVPTLPNQALFYRLCNDLNPIHADPELAKRIGFERPILHGLCTYGTACGTIIRNVCDYDANAIKRFDARFASPVYPGETLITDIWIDGRTLSFQCRVKERDLVVLKNGLCELN